MSDYLDFITNSHSLYNRYYDEWKLCINSWYGGVEYKDAAYLRAYASDMNTSSETINTYSTNADGVITGKSRAQVEIGYDQNAVNRGDINIQAGSFYGEKLENTPVYNFTKLVVSEYNSMLFRTPPQRLLPDTPEIDIFKNDVNGESDNLNEFWSQVDLFSTIYGVCHVECYKPVGSDIPKWKLHAPTDVTNWEYKYDVNGNLILTRMVIRLESNDYHQVYRYYTDSTVETVWVGADDDYIPPINAEGLELFDENSYRIVQPNELGYIPVTTVYQSLKVYNGVGSTVIQDVAGIQRSIFGDSAEIYAGITYGSHPTLIVDETTAQMNDGMVGAEPGATIQVQSGLTGQSSYVYEFASPDLASLAEIRIIIDSKIDKLSTIAMLRSEDLVKSSRSGEQIEVYDDKLAAMIRKKATNLENAESKCWDMWFDWTNQQRPDDFSISYNRQFNKRALEQELSEIQKSMQLLHEYEDMFMHSETEQYDIEDYTTEAQAIKVAERLGGTGFHTHTREDGLVTYMPFATHLEYEQAIESTGNGEPASEQDLQDTEFLIDMRDKIRMRLKQLLDSSTTSNGL